jgi:hypothetical protein
MTIAAWIPPDNPDPSAILDSAARDGRDGRHAVALAKFLWFHQEAIKHEPALSAVRLSFALGYWLDLAAEYPPAREAFIQTRNVTEARFREQPGDYSLFHDVAALNGYLGTGKRTVDLFTEFAGQNHEAAQRLYHVAERYLLAAGRYRECAPFLEPARQLEIAAQLYHLSKQHEESLPEIGFPIPRLARPHYIEKVATLIALLVVNDRADEARTAYATALEIIDDTDFRTIMDAALTGHFPDRQMR